MTWGQDETDDLTEARARVAELEEAIRKIVAASDNDGGSASDAIQDMLDIAEDVLERRPVQNESVVKP